jgi:hypothetical protein
MNGFEKNISRRAQWNPMSAALSSPFGLELFRRKFGAQADEILAKFGTYSRGPRKGLPRGYLYWQKVTAGGWGNLDPWSKHGSMGVLRPGSRGYMACIDFNDAAARFYPAEANRPAPVETPRVMYDNSNQTDAAKMFRLVGAITMAGFRKAYQTQE